MRIDLSLRRVEASIFSVLRSEKTRSILGRLGPVKYKKRAKLSCVGGRKTWSTSFFLLGSVAQFTGDLMCLSANGNSPVETAISNFPARLV